MKCLMLYHMNDVERRGGKDTEYTQSEFQEHNTDLLTSLFVQISSLELMYLTQLNLVPFDEHFSCLNPSLITGILYIMNLILLDFTYV